MSAYATVVARIRERAVRFEAKPAVIEEGAVFSYGALFERIDRLSQAFLTLGIRKGDAVLAFLPNVHEAIECELAALQSGLAWITLTARLTWAEVRGVTASCKPALILTDAAGLTKIREGLTPLPLEGLPPLVLTGSAAAPGDGTPSAPYGYESSLATHRPEAPGVTVGPEDVARLRYTSGTTGSAKAAVLPHRVYDASLENLLRELPTLDERDRALHVAPLTHGSGALVYPMLWAGGANVLETHFDVGAVFRSIEAHRITMLFTVPTILSRLVASVPSATESLESLRAVIYGGAPMPESQLAAAVQQLRPVLMQIYGMTEAPWPITTLKPAEHRLGNPRLRSVGQATSVCDLRVVDEGGAALPPDQIGEIEIRGRNVMQGYYADPAGTEAVLKDGWLRSGDLGYLDGAGFLFIVGRKKEVIISGGFNVYAGEVEAALCSDERILEAAVVGVPDDEWGEKVVAFVVGKSGVPLRPEAVDASLRSRLSGYKCPREIHVVDELPRSPTGKVLKRELVQARKNRNDPAKAG